jgi:hypothetical protein
MGFTFGKSLAGVAAAVALLACGGSPDSRAVEPLPSSAPQPPPGEPGTPTIGVSFKLDPRLQGGTYGGEVWVSPATYWGISGQDSVETRAHGIDATGTAMDLVPEWIPSDSGMVSVSPARGAQVTISVAHGGQSTLTVNVGPLSKELLIRATSGGGAVEQVSITQ